jgi:hypothetical protein
MRHGRGRDKSGPVAVVLLLLLFFFINDTDMILPLADCRRLSVSLFFFLDVIPNQRRLLAHM